MAKAKSAYIIQWLIILITYLTISVREPLWIALLTVAIFILYNIIQIYYIFLHHLTRSYLLKYILWLPGIIK